MYNKGLHQYRFRKNPEENRFAQAWELCNQNPEKFCNAQKTLDYLLGEGCRPVEVTDRDREIAATVVQWLGSPVGNAS